MHAKQAKLAEVLGKFTDRKVTDFEPFGDLRDDILGAELSDGVANRDLVVRQRRIQAERVAAG